MLASIVVPTEMFVHCYCVWRLWKLETLASC